MNRRLLVSLLLFMLVASPVAAQPPVLIQPSPTPAAPCSVLASQTAASGSAVTATVTVTGGYVYICGIELTLACGTTTCTAIAATATPTTNLGGLSFLMPSTGMGAAAGTAFTQYFYYPNPLKSSAPGTNVVVGATPAVTNGVWRVNVYGYFWPN